MAENLNDLRGFLLVAQTGSFTKAGAQLGVSQSALSHSIKGLETRLGIKLLQRTTRSISTTEAGEQLFQRLQPLFTQLNDELNALGQFSGKLKGQLKINGTEHAFLWLWHKFQHFMQHYPDVQLELMSETRFTDIVSEKYDAGIRLGDDVEKDMIAMRISPDMQMCVITSPDYLSRQGTPKTPFELESHSMAAVRLPTSGGLLNWDFRDPVSRKVIKIAPHGQFICNASRHPLNYALGGLGLAWLPRAMVEQELNTGSLIEVLTDWAICYDGYHLYYPSRRADLPIFQALITSLKE